MELYVNAVQKIANDHSLGTPESPAQWMIPLSEDRKSFGTITMSNVRTRKMISGLEKMIKLWVIDGDRKGKMD